MTEIYWLSSNGRMVACRLPLVENSQRLVHDFPLVFIFLSHRLVQQPIHHLKRCDIPSRSVFRSSGSANCIGQFQSCFHIVFSCVSHHNGRGKAISTPNCVHNVYVECILMQRLSICGVQSSPVWPILEHHPLGMFSFQQEFGSFSRLPLQCECFRFFSCQEQYVRLSHGMLQVLLPYCWPLLESKCARADVEEQVCTVTSSFLHDFVQEGRF
mmetsp:Transcript_3322/g.20712  ORF Transcript_3322/g.20712 Transcript_3322/m.20712 type:complete len:213 (+) Transcript_3322:516-1154(+)